ncbi:DUF1707 domain-containing protein [Streptomyces puniciscabiei]|uniref:DUF1707 domain-containing protein n=1 Tax=Streptomyces puniciscabiei TaxID=164348 RepID=UPI0006EBD622|nr:DUF1707 domain-containing protein [Streptomyces puniciscabiei]
MTPLPEDSSPLISEDDRGMAVQRLQESYAEGLVSHEELDELWSDTTFPDASHSAEASRS